MSVLNETTVTVDGFDAKVLRGGAESVPRFAKDVMPALRPVGEPAA